MRRGKPVWNGLSGRKPDTLLSCNRQEFRQQERNCPMKKVLKGGTVVSGEGCKKADVLIEDGKIGAVAPEITDEEAEVVDVSGKLLFPGFIDAHTHFDLHVSGTVTADNFETGNESSPYQAAQTMIIDFATQYKEKAYIKRWRTGMKGRRQCFL